MSIAVSFNINNYVFVELTDHAKSVLKKDRLRLLEEFPLVPNKELPPEYEEVNGFAKFQMWELMAAFGKHMYNGAPSLFKGGIRLDIKSIDPYTVKAEDIG